MSDTIGTIRGVRYNDTESIVASDFNDEQKYLHAMLLDNVLGAGLRCQPGDVVPSGSYVFTFGGGGILPGTGSLTLSNAEGTIAQFTGSAILSDTGSLLIYRLAAGELNTTMADPPSNAGAARFDAVFVRLRVTASYAQTRDFVDVTTQLPSTAQFNKRNYVVCDKLYVTGSERWMGTGPASVPSTPAGYAPYGYVWHTGSAAAQRGILTQFGAVPFSASANLGGGFTPRMGLIDYRVPWKVKTFYVPAMGGYNYLPSEWVPAHGPISAEGAIVLTASAPGITARAFMPSVGENCRLLGIQAHYGDTGLTPTPATLGYITFDTNKYRDSLRVVGVPGQFGLSGSNVGFTDTGGVYYNLLQTGTLPGMTAYWGNGHAIPVEVPNGHTTAHNDQIVCQYSASSTSHYLVGTTFVIGEY